MSPRKLLVWQTLHSSPNTLNRGRSVPSSAGLSRGLGLNSGIGSVLAGPGAHVEGDVLFQNKY